MSGIKRFSRSINPLRQPMRRIQTGHRMSQGTLKAETQTLNIPNQIQRGVYGGDLLTIFVGEAHSWQSHGRDGAGMQPYVFETQYCH